MAVSFVVHVDESGDEGFRFDEGSSEWFLLSGVVLRRSSELSEVKLVDEVRDQLGKPPKKPLHFRDLKHHHRVPYVDRIAQASLRIVNILVHKPSLTEPEVFQQGYRLYFYAVRYLLERVSWFCRDHRRADDPGDGTAEIVFSNRASMSYTEMREYLTLLADLRTSIVWDVIKPKQVVAYSGTRRMGLQIADAVAGSFYKAVELDRLGYTEDRYARTLRPVVYRYNGRARNYGLKFWPVEVAHMVDTEARFAWLREVYT